MDTEIQAISKAAQASQATYLAYRAASKADAMTSPPRGSYAAREDTLKAYHRAASIEARLRNAYRLAHGCEALI